MDLSIYIAELIGTAMLVFLGDGVVANVVLNKTKGNNSGWIVITFGWACAVLVPAICFGNMSGAHFNPALTLGLAIIGVTKWSVVPGYILCQFIGAIIGACLVYISYKDHFDVTEDKGAKLAVFCTAPGIRNTSTNFICEFLTTFMLVFALQGLGQGNFVNGVNYFGVGGVILVLGICLGGTTGYAINPARDLGPRIAHAFLPIKNKGDSDWGYAWIPVAGPVLGAICAALLSTVVFK
jgi:glycerol uptake facilitator protein